MIEYITSGKKYKSKKAAINGATRFQRLLQENKVGHYKENKSIKETFDFMHGGGFVGFGKWNGRAFGRTQNNLLGLNVITIDIDDGRDIQETLLKLPIKPNFWMTSSSFTNEFHKFKMFYVLDRDLNKDDFPHFAKFFITKLLSVRDADPCSWTFNQLTFGSSSSIKFGEYYHSDFIEVPQDLEPFKPKVKEFVGTNHLQVDEKDIVERIYNLGKPDYQTTLQIVIALGQMGLIEVFYATCPQHKHHEYEGLFHKAANGEFPNKNNFIWELLLGKEATTDTDIIYVEKYLSEAKEVTDALKVESDVTIVAPTGCGKTHTVTKELEKENVIFLVPNSSMKETLNKYGYIRCGGDFDSVDKQYKNGAKKLVACYEGLKYSNETPFSNFILVIDEVHTLVKDLHYRNNLQILELKKKFKRVITLTGTPNTVPKVFLNNVITVRRKENPIINWKVLKPKEKLWSPEQQLALVSKMKKKFKGTPTLYIRSDRKGFEDEMVYSENKNDSEMYKKLLETEMLEGFLMSTMIIEAGINIRNKKLNIVIDLKGLSLSEESVLQIVGRAREAKEFDVYVVARGYNSKKVSVEEVMEDAEKTAKILNNHNDTTNIKVLALHLMHCLRFESGSWNVDTDNISIATMIRNKGTSSSEEIVNKCSNGKYEVLKFEEEVEREVKVSKQRASTIVKNWIEENGSDEIIEYLNIKIETDNRVRANTFNKILSDSSVRRYINKIVSEGISRQESVVFSEFESVGELLVHEIVNGKPNKYDKLVFSKEISLVCSELLEIESDSLKLTKIKSVLSSSLVGVPVLKTMKYGEISAMLKKRFSISLKVDKNKVYIEK